MQILMGNVNNLILSSEDGQDISTVSLLLELGGNALGVKVIREI